MNLNERVKNAINNDSHTKQLHRYSASNIYALLNGWENLETYLEPKIFDFENAYRMWQGKQKHRQIQELLPEYQQEVKIEKEIDGLTIVGMADLLDDSEVIEIKTSEKLYPKAKTWHSHQLRLYLTLFERDKGRVVQPIVNKRGLELKTIGTYKRDDKWFQEQIDKLRVIDKKITKYYEQNTRTKS